MPTVDPKLLAKAKHLWAQFEPEAQDMTFKAFLAEIIAMTDPQKMREDMMKIELIRAREKSAKLRIDKAIHNRRKRYG